MKKILGVLLVMLLGVALVACKKDPEPTPGLSDKDIIAAAKTQLSIGNADQLSKVTADLELPEVVTVSSNQVNVTWTVKESAVTAVQIDGKLAKVTRPDTGAGDVKATLVAALSYKAEKDTKEFAITVLQKEQAPVFKTIKEMAKYVKDNNITLSDKDDQAMAVEFESLTLIGKRNNPGAAADGFYLSDGSSSIFVYGNTTAEVGTTGKVVTALRHYFNGYQLVGSKTSFEGTTTKKTDAQIKAMATTRKVQDFVDTFESAQKDLAGAKQNLDIMGFFKLEAYVYNDTTITNDARYSLVFRDTDTKEGTNLIQAYYISQHFDTLKGLGAEPKKVTVWANVQEIRDNIQAGPNNSAMPIVYRVTVISYEVSLTDQEKVEADKAAVTSAVSKNLHHVKVGKTNLPLTGGNGSTMSYAFANAADVNNALVDLATLEVKSVPEGVKEVKLVATIKVNDATLTHAFSIFVGQPTALTAITAIKDIADGMYVKIQGKVKGKSGEIAYDPQYKNAEIYIYNGDNEILAYRIPAKIGDVNVEELLVDAEKTGKEVVIYAKVGSHQGNKQIVATFVEVKLA